MWAYQTCSCVGVDCADSMVASYRVAMQIVCALEVLFIFGITIAIMCMTYSLCQFEQS